MKKTAPGKRITALLLSAVLLFCVSAGAAAQENDTGNGTKDGTANDTRIRASLTAVTLWQDGQEVMKLDSLNAKADIVSDGDVSGIRLQISQEDSEVAWAAISLIDEKIQLEMHGELSGQSAKYVLDPAAASELFLGGKSAGPASGSPEKYTAEAQESETGEDMSQGGAEESAAEGQESGTEGDVSQDAADEPAAEGQEPETGENISQGDAEEFAAEGQESGAEGDVSQDDEEESAAEGQESETGEDMPQNDTEEPAAESQESETEGDGPGGEVRIGPVELKLGDGSLEKLVAFAGAVSSITSDCFAGGKKMEVAGKKCAAHGFVVDAGHAERLMEAVLDKGEKIPQIEEVSFLWGSHGSWSAAEYRIGEKKDGTVQWIRGTWVTEGKELTVSHGVYGEDSVPESGFELKFDLADSEGDASWLPSDTSDATDLTEMTPVEIMEQITGGIQIILADVTQGVLPVVVESMSEDYLDRLYETVTTEEPGTETGEETGAEEEPGTETGEETGAEEEPGTETGEETGAEEEPGTETGEESGTETAEGENGEPGAENGSGEGTETPEEETGTEDAEETAENAAGQEITEGTRKPAYVDVDAQARKPVPEDEEAPDEKE